MIARRTQPPTDVGEHGLHVVGEIGIRQGRGGGRADDVAEVIQHRLLVFAETTGPATAVTPLP